MTVKWQDPPGLLPPQAHAGKWAREAAELRKRPGQWALIAERSDRHIAYQMAYHINHSTLKAFRPSGSFEAAGRGREVYARYVGKG